MKSKIVKLLALTQSPNEHESLSAIRAANKLLTKERLTWEQFFAGSGFRDEAPKVKREHYSSASNKYQGSTDELEDMLDYLLSRWPGNKFYESVANFYQTKGFVTEKQFEAVQKAYRK